MMINKKGRHIMSLMYTISCLRKHPKKRVINIFQIFFFLLGNKQIFIGAHLTEEESCDISIQCS